MKKNDISRKAAKKNKGIVGTSCSYAGCGEARTASGNTNTGQRCGSCLTTSYAEQ